MDCATPIDRSRLDRWVTEAWSQASELTKLHDMGELFSKPNPMSPTNAADIDQSLKQVQELLGPKFKIPMKAVIPGEDRTVQAKVDVSCLLANVLMF